jgi:hypothetical protein
VLETASSEVLHEALRRIEGIAQLSDGLAIVIVVGPASHSREFLEQVAAVLVPNRDVFWHSLDSRGADLTESLGSTARRSVLLVHGMEWLAAEDREEIETAINLSRDTLKASHALIVFWVDARHLDEFRSLCPDLFHWRSLLVTIGEEDLSLPAAVIELRLHAHYLQEARPIPRKLYVEPRLQPETGNEAVPLSTWATAIEHGCLEGKPGSGKSIGVAMYAADQARRVVELGDGLVPFLVAVRAVEAPRADSGYLSAIFASQPPGPVSREVLEQWASDGKLQIIIDGFDEISADSRERWIDWLHRIRRGYPRIRTLLVSRPFVSVPDNWHRAEVLPWDRAQIDAYLKQKFSPRQRNALIDALEQSPFLQEMARTPIALAILVEVNRHLGFLPSDRMTLLRMYVETLLGGRDAAKGLAKFRSVTSPQSLRRQLAQIAVQLLERGSHRFRAEDLSGWYYPLEELRYLIERTGLIQQVSEEIYAFSHRSLFEYFAAEGLIDLGARKALTLMLEHGGDPLWKDVIVLAASQLLALVDEPDAVLGERMRQQLEQLAECP